MTTRDDLISRWFNQIFIVATLFVFAYPVGRLGYWLFHHAWMSFTAAMVAWIAAILISRYSFSGPNMKVRYLLVHWMGCSFILATVTLFSEAVRPWLEFSNDTWARLVILSGLMVVVFAVIMSHVIAVKRLTIRNPRIDRCYRIAQISDVHIGSRQAGFLRRIVRKLNALNPEIVVVTGDLIDSTTVEIEALDSIRQLNAVTLFCIGNHERYADLPKVLDMAEQLGMIVLRQQIHHHDQLCFFGIDDADRVDQVAMHLPSLPLDANKFNILLYHRPVGWEAAIDHGIDLMLSGHTHNGQIFPFNFLVKRQFSRIAGHYVNCDAHLYVSSGTGTWGPLMRFGTSNEITLFNLEPTIL